MSFSLDIKEELARAQPACSHCNRSLLAAYARMAGALHMQTVRTQTLGGQDEFDQGARERDERAHDARERDERAHGAREQATHMQGAGAFSLEISSDIALVARTLTQILHDEYSLQTDITMRRSVLHKNVNYLIDVPTQPPLMDVLQDLGFFHAEDPEESNNSASATMPKNGSVAPPSTSSARLNAPIIFNDGISQHLVAKQCCAAAYVRGAFLASGFVSDPKSNAHFEMTFENETLARDVSDILSKNQIPARVKNRRGAFVVYLKSGEHIVNFLSFTGAHTCALKYEEARVMKSVRSGVNRQINAELANQKRAAVAAVDQVFAARAVIKHYGANKLTPALQEFVRLRIKYPNASLSELGKHANPPLSKSAVAHRVRRMMQLAKDIEDEC